MHKCQGVRKSIRKYRRISRFRLLKETHSWSAEMEGREGGMEKYKAKGELWPVSTVCWGTLKSLYLITQGGGDSQEFEIRLTWLSLCKMDWS